MRTRYTRYTYVYVVRCLIVYSERLNEIFIEADENYNLMSYGRKLETDLLHTKLYTFYAAQECFSIKNEFIVRN